MSTEPPDYWCRHGFRKGHCLAPACEHAPKPKPALPPEIHAAVVFEQKLREARKKPEPEPEPPSAPTEPQSPEPRKRRKRTLRVQRRNWRALNAAVDDLTARVEQLEAQQHRSDTP